MSSALQFGRQFESFAIATAQTCDDYAVRTPEQRDRFVPPAMRADEVWCQLFSEPSGGSDLAALRTRAERDGDGWVVNGQKIWNSGAHYSDFGILVARSDPNVPKHAGLTFFILDMKAPGVEIRPIRQLSGSAHFHEVFFTNVRIPDSMRIGPVGGGWRVAASCQSPRRAGFAKPSPRPESQVGSRTSPSRSVRACARQFD